LIRISDCDNFAHDFSEPEIEERALEAIQEIEAFLENHIPYLKGKVNNG
jgi:uncharacterized membrane protein